MLDDADNLDQNNDMRNPMPLVSILVQRSLLLFCRIREFTV